jgi:hypothetical protein
MVPTRSTASLQALTLAALEYLSQKVCARKPLIRTGGDARQVLMTACRNAAGKKGEKAAFPEGATRPSYIRAIKTVAVGLWNFFLEN